MLSEAFVLRAAGLMKKPERECDVLPRAIARQLFAKNGLSDDHPFMFADDFTSEKYLEIMSKLRDKNGNQLSAPSLDTYRSALRRVYVDYDKPLPRKFDSLCTRFLHGYQRVTTQRNADQASRSHIGKDNLLMSDYKRLCMNSLKMDEANGSFAHLYAILAWNLMARSSNVAKIGFSQIVWRGDCVDVYYGVQKTDQEGTRAHYARAIYANPVSPGTCAILAFAVPL